MLELEPIDRELLDGSYGAAAARAMSLLLRYGRASGADRFVSIHSAHIDGCLYHGPSSIDFARCFVDLGGRVRVPTTLNVAAVDVVHPDWHCGPQELLAQQRELTELHETLGCVPTLTCAPYQRMFRPLAGQHVAWAESNAIVFANSVLGARTDRYGDFADLCAALTGRVPLAGLHREENRKAQCVVDVAGADQVEICRDLYFGVLGYVLGKRLPAQIPFIRGLPQDTSEDELKALGAAGAASGALALFHAEGITPESAQPLDDALPHIGIDASELGAAVELLCPLAEGEPVAAVCLGTPHYSRREFERLSEIIAGRVPSSSVVIYASTSREMAAEIENDDRFDPLRSFGVRIVVDTCTYLAPVVRNPSGAIVTTSAKYAHYGPGNLRRRVGLMSLERCIRSAELGAVAAC